MKTVQVLGFGDPRSAKCAGTWIASTAGAIALSESLSEPLVAGDQKVSLASLLHSSTHSGT